MEHFISLSIITIEQFFAENSPATPLEKEKENGNSWKTVKEERVCGFSRRLGVHLIGDDGAIINKTDVLPNLCNVASSVILDSETYFLPN